jgi:hypothetical protein
MHDETLKYPTSTIPLTWPDQTWPDQTWTYPTLPYPNLPLKKEKKKEGEFVRGGSVAARPWRVCTWSTYVKILIPFSKKVFPTTPILTWPDQTWPDMNLALPYLTLLAPPPYIGYWTR